jgi:beta-mannosidase
VQLSITPPTGKKITRNAGISGQAGRSSLSYLVRIPEPRLWWPNGMGKQPLYQVVVRIVFDGRVSDERKLHTGLRTVEIDRSGISSNNSRFCIRINGQDVFCRGGNWIPADAIMVRVSRRKYEQLIEKACKANFNILRVWGGGIYESSDFYDACDRAGILVWQDFMFACSEYPDATRDFRTAVRDEAENVVMSLRHHPCIVLFGNKDLNIGGSVIYNQILPDVCRLLDPKRPYWPGSPFGGDNPNSEKSGDCHWWGPFTMNEDINQRITHEVFDECKARFVSEYGVIGPCHLSSVKKYLAKEELYIGSPAWKEHTNTYEKDTTPAGIKRHYADPENLSIEDYILYGQMFQATLYGQTIEALRFRKNDPINDCQGALIWMFNDCWGETGWTPVDYYLRHKPSFYWIRNANTPLRAIVRKRGNHLVTRAVNDTLKQVEPEIHYGWMRIDGSDSKMRSETIRIHANRMVEIGRETIPGEKDLDPKEWIYTAYLNHEDTGPTPSVWLLVPYRELVMPDPEISVTIRGRNIRLLSKTYCHGVHFKDEGKGLFSDNYFDLMPGVPKSIQCLASKMPVSIQFHTL